MTEIAVDQGITLKAEIPEAAIKQYLDDAIAESVKHIEWCGLNEASKQSGIDKKKLTFVLNKFKHKLDVDYGGCVFYPLNGGKYVIEPVAFKEFYKKHFDLIQRMYLSKEAV